MQVGNGVHMLEIGIDLLGRKETICPVLLQDRDRAILIDTAYPGQVKKILRMITDTGVDIESIRQIIITHHDIDHIGSLAGLARTLPDDVQILAHEGEIPYITGKQAPAKWNPEAVAGMEEQLGQMNAAQRLAIKAVFDNFHRLTARVDRPLADGEELPECGGIIVIHTPGHSPGHICLYLRQSRILIAGDALFASEGGLWATPPFLNLDQEQYRRSLAKLTRFDIQTVICYHGGLYSDNPNQRIAELVSIAETGQI